MLLPLMAGLVLLSAAPRGGFTRPAAASAQASRRSYGTAAPDPTRMAEIESSFQKFQQSRGGKRSDGGVTIPVYFHVINKGPGIENGDVPDHMLRAQLRGLNDSYAGAMGAAATPFRFELTGIDRTTNADWFDMGILSIQQRQAKAAAPQGRPRGAEFLHDERRRLSGVGHFPLELPFAALAGRCRGVLRLAARRLTRPLQRG